MRICVGIPFSYPLDHGGLLHPQLAGPYWPIRHVEELVGDLEAMAMLLEDRNIH
jgi:hypothetical protein